MRDAWNFGAVAIGVAFALAPVESARAAGAPFDGIWTVEVDCPNVGDVEGYDWPSDFMSGLYRSATNSAIGHITGRIGPDGRALLTMFGRTGPEQAVIGHERPGTPFRYTVDAHFNGNSGSGKRNERRACALTFGKS